MLATGLLTCYSIRRLRKASARTRRTTRRTGRRRTSIVQALIGVLKYIVDINMGWFETCEGDCL